MCPFNVGDLVLWREPGTVNAAYWDGVGPGYRVLAVDLHLKSIHVESKEGVKEVSWHFFVPKPRSLAQGIKRNLPGWF